MASVEVASSPGSGLSSPPHSPQSNGNNSTIRVASSSGGVAANTSTSSATPAAAAAAQQAPTHSGPPPRLTAAGTIRKKPGPKPKPKDPNAPEKKPRKPRKPVEPRDPAIEPAPRKRRGKASLEAAQAAALAPPPPQVIEEKPVLVAEAQHQQSPQAQAQVQPQAQAQAQQQTPQQQQQQQQQQQHTPTATPQTRPTELASVLQTEQSTAVTQGPRVLSNPEPIHNNPSLSHINAAPSTPRPASSGQRYDPIRGGLMDSKPQSSASAPPPPISPPLNRASASPSITSLIDPPSISSYSQTARLQHQPSVTSAPVSPAAASSRPASVLPLHQEHQQIPRLSAPLGSSASANTAIPMDVDSDHLSAAKASVPMKKTDSSTGTPSHSNAPTPPVKPQRQKEAPPPLPTGSGLLSGTPFGPAVSNGSTGPNDPQGVNIWLTFPLKGQANVTINFAQEVEKKYGFAALHPKIAARKERLRQVTAAGAALEKAAGTGSADDMSLDLSEPESNVEMGGMDDEGSATNNNGVKKRRKRKQEDYDKDDDFIDDTELAWEQQALMAKDGFFVYSGPLITEGEKPTVERPDGTVKRGRGRGRGGTVRGETSGRGRGRGGGPGSRGGSTVRKPRVTKADRAMMEQEKHQREKLAQTIAAKQPMAYASTTAL